MGGGCKAMDFCVCSLEEAHLISTVSCQLPVILEAQGSDTEDGRNEGVQPWQDNMKVVLCRQQRERSGGGTRLNNNYSKLAAHQGGRLTRDQLRCPIKGAPSVTRTRVGRGRLPLVIVVLARYCTRVYA